MIYLLLSGVLLLFGGLALIMRNPVLIGLHVVPALALLAFVAARRRGELRERLGAASGRRGAWFGSNVALQTLALSVLLGSLAYAARRAPLRWDLTEAGQFTLSDGSLKVLSQIPDDVELELVAFYAVPGAVREFLDLYSFASDKLRYRIVDANRNPLLAKQLGVERDQTLVVCVGPCAQAKKRIQVDSPNEATVTRALRRAIAEPRTVMFVSGHDEANLEQTDAPGLSAVVSLLDQENIDIAPLLLAQASEVPASAEALVIVAPSFSFFDRELALLESYLRRGGRLVLLVEPLQRVKLDELLTKFDIRLGADIIVDQQLEVMGSGALGVQPIVSQYAQHPVTRVLEGKPTVFNLVRTVEPIADPSDGGQLTVLFRSSPESLAVPDDALGPEGLNLDDARDRPGPHPLAVARTIPNSEGGPEGRLIVVGDSNFIRNRSVVEGSNADLFLNMVNWMVNEEGFIAIERKRPRASRVEFTATEYRTLSYFVILFIPESILMLGVLNWWRRRRS